MGALSKQAKVQSELRDYCAGLNVVAEADCPLTLSRCRFLALTMTIADELAAFSDRADSPRDRICLELA